MGIHVLCSEVLFHLFPFRYHAAGNKNRPLGGRRMGGGEKHRRHSVYRRIGQLTRLPSALHDMKKKGGGGGENEEHFLPLLLVKLSMFQTGRATHCATSLTLSPKWAQEFPFLKYFREYFLVPCFSAG